MADLHDMTAVELLQWMRRHPNDTGLSWTSTLMTLDAAGLTDLDLALRYGRRLTGPLGTALAALTDRGRVALDPPLTETDLDRLQLVGADVYRLDRANAEEWEQVAHLVQKHSEAWKQHRPGIGRQADTVPDTVISRLLAAGRGPTYARRLIEAAARLGVGPDTYGYDIRPEEFTDLAAAGVPNRRHVEAYRYALRHRGIERVLPDREHAAIVQLATAGVHAGAAIAAARQGVPYGAWPTRLAGFHDSWFRLRDEHDYDHRQGVTVTDSWLALPTHESRQFTLDDFRFFADHGWGDIHLSWLLQASVGGSRRSGSYARWDVHAARHFAEIGLRPETIGAYATALVSGAQGEDGPKAFVSHWPDKYDDRARALLRDVERLRAAGVTAASITDYRWCGCRSVEDVLKAHAVGIDGKRVRQLRDQHGTRQWSSTPKRIKRFDQLLAAHEGNLL